MALPVRLRKSDQRTVDHPDATGLQRWDPLADLERLNRELASDLDPWRRFPSLLDGAFRPLADVEETAEDYRVEIELPGIGKQDVDVEIAGRRLTVTGERKERERVGILRKRERTVDQFRYEVTLPGDVDDAHAEARLDRGVLAVSIHLANLVMWR